MEKQSKLDRVVLILIQFMLVFLIGLVVFYWITTGRLFSQELAFLVCSYWLLVFSFCTFDSEND